MSGGLVVVQGWLVCWFCWFEVTVMRIYRGLFWLLLLYTRPFILTKRASLLHLKKSPNGKIDYDFLP
jgi:hypothetical protein